MGATLMLIGLGHLGGVLLEFLVREESLGRIVACGRDVSRGTARCNLARLNAVADGLAADVEFRFLDLGDDDAVADAVRRESPDVILNTASMQTWWLVDLLPPGAAARLKRAGFGVWLPVHLPLTLKLMRALRESGYSGVTLTASYPDVINCILGRLQLAPTCGVGNLDEIVLKVQMLAANRLGASLEAVHVLLVAHHALEDAAFNENERERHDGQIPPYFLRVELEGRDVAAEVAADELLLAPYPLPPGPAWSFLTAASTARLIRALVGDEPKLLHAPGPDGLPGGYPVDVGGGEVRPAPIDGLSLEGAIDINERSHRFDGIERIEVDGTVVFGEESVEVMRQELGYDCPRLRPDEAEQRGTELVDRFREYAGRHGVDVEGPGIFIRTTEAE